MDADGIFETNGELEPVEPTNLTAEDTDAIFTGMEHSGA